MTSGEAGQVVVRRVEEEQRYELVVDGEVVSVLGFDLRGTDIVLLHTATQPGRRGQGHATRLVDAVLDDIAGRGLVPAVRCPFVRQHLRSRTVR